MWKIKMDMSSFRNLISLPIFILSLSIGIFFVYITDTPKDIIYVYPTPENADKVQYKDRTGNCFKYEAVKTKCPKDRSKIESYQAQ
jgi:hypothetical protein